MCGLIHVLFQGAREANSKLMTVRLGETHQVLGDLPQQLTFVRHARGQGSFLHTSELLPLLKVQTLIPTTNNKQNSIPLYLKRGAADSPRRKVSDSK